MRLWTVAVGPPKQGFTLYAGLKRLVYQAYGLASRGAKLSVVVGNVGQCMQEVVVRQEFITLGQLLKLVGEVDSGGEVKSYLAEETPLVNGEPETRRGRKLRHGDTIVLKRTGEIRCVAE